MELLSGFDSRKTISDIIEVYQLQNFIFTFKLMLTN
jgi:hypothetical protein